MLGWRSYFSQQISLEELALKPPVRVTEVHRGGLCVQGDGLDETIPPRSDVTIGDWLLFDRERTASSRLLTRSSLFKRRAPGTGRQTQLIAANVDTAFIVSSCNQDFNVARLERYLALAFEAEVTPVIVLTKSDLSSDPESYLERAGSISEKVPAVLLDARGEQPGVRLAEWCRPGQTVAFMGSSGVGKSTLVNALSDNGTVTTQAIREDDSKGRHTTTHRQLHILPDGCAVLDTPGMRELQLTDAEAGVAGVFADIHSLSRHCRFSDCQHETEPGCAILAALERGEVDTGRLARWRKLAREERHNSATLAEKKSKARSLGKTIRMIQKQSRK